ncbi:somatostatin-2-like [Clupea harengus]|uniref:Somatostatin-2-like n=1 Tax=Clupea harengus TaxID=7950 RepID=A0A6P8G366_CLUHA|nr:somatostatin-2-like [Clupea harengus]
MRPSGMHCSLALLALSVVLCSHATASHPDQNRDLRHSRLLQRARAAAAMATQWSKRTVEDLLSQMSLPETEVPEESEVSMAELKGDLDLDLDLDLERPAEPKYLPPRARKADCFYWKSFAC